MVGATEAVFCPAVTMTAWLWSTLPTPLLALVAGLEFVPRVFPVQ